MSENVLSLVPPSPAKPRGDRATAALAALIIFVNGGVQIARIAAYTAVLLLAAIGALSLIGR